MIPMLSLVTATVQSYYIIDYIPYTLQTYNLFIL